MALVDQYAGVIFDYGGVLVAHQTAADVQQLAALAEMPVDQFSDLYWVDRAAYDKAAVSGEEYWQRIAESAGRRFTAEQVQQLTEADVASWLKFDEQMYEFANRLKDSGKRIAVLSNMPKDLGETLKSRTKGFEPFEHLTLSYEVNCVKPNPDIYEHCVAGIGLKPSDTLFLDDRQENIEAAKRLGIYAIQFTSREEVLPGLTA